MDLIGRLKRKHLSREMIPVSVLHSGLDSLYYWSGDKVENEN